MPLMGMAVASATGVGAWNWMTLVVWYVVLPVLDLAIGSDPNNPPESAVERLDRDPYYRILTYLTVPVHHVILITAAWYVATRPLGVASLLGLTLSVGLVSGLAINTYCRCAPSAIHLPSSARSSGVIWVRLRNGIVLLSIARSRIRGTISLI